MGVGVDDRPESLVALELAHQLAREAGCGLRLRTAVSVPAAYAATYAYAIDWASLHEDLATNARHALTDVEEGIQDVPVVVEVDKERAVDSLAKLSELVDLLVVGSRSWGTFGRVLVGSTADSLLRHAHCPVIVVPPAPAPVPEPQTAPAEQAAAA